MIAQRPVLTLFAAALALITLQACSAPSATVLDAPITTQLQQGIKDGSATFDHAVYDAVLRKHVDAKTGRVSYSALKTERADLDSYIKKLGDADLTKLPRDEQLALLINAYNAFTLKLIIDNLDGLNSIRDLPQPWDTAAYTLGGHTVSLNDIEHGLIRPLYKDPRIHFAVNCASIGCPPLLPTAYTGPGIEKQLTTATQGFATNPNYVTTQGDTLKVSKILKWYGGDFTDTSYKGHASTLANYLKPLVSDDVRALIEKHGGDPSVDFLDYDWNLNKQ